MKKTLNDLIEEYKKMAKICHNIDYQDKKSVANNNKAVHRMYKIIDTIKLEFSTAGVDEFAKLLDDQDNRADLWAAVQMLEKMEVDSTTEQKALKIIEIEARESMGMDYWLKTYKEKKGIEDRTMLDRLLGKLSRLAQ